MLQWTEAYSDLTYCCSATACMLLLSGTLLCLPNAG